MWRGVTELGTARQVAGGGAGPRFAPSEGGYLLGGTNGTADRSVCGALIYLWRDVTEWPDRACIVRESDGLCTVCLRNDGEPRVPECPSPRCECLPDAHSVASLWNCHRGAGLVMLCTLCGKSSVGHKAVDRFFITTGRKSNSEKISLSRPEGSLLQRRFNSLSYFL